MSTPYLIVTEGLRSSVILPWLFDSREEFDRAVRYCAENRDKVRVRYATANGGDPDYITDADELVNYFEELADL